MSNEEIDLAKDIISKENIPFVNLDEALEFSEIKIATNGEIIIYIISLPTVKKDNCKAIEIRAIKRNGKINKIDFNEFLICEKEIYEIKEKCKCHNSLEICLRDNIIDLRNEV